MIAFPAPAMCQGADEDLMIQLGAIIFPECLRRWPDENGFRIWVDGSPTEPAASSEAAVARFQTVLGVLRAWRPEAGELQEEQRAGLGAGSIRDEAGGQTLMLGRVAVHVIFGGEIEALADRARRGIAASQRLRNALWLNGRPNRTAADYYMIYEYALQELGGGAGIKLATGITVGDQKRLRASANNLSPLEGGRHANGGGIATMTLGRQRALTSELLRRWIETYASSLGQLLRSFFSRAAYSVPPSRAHARCSLSPLSA